MTKAAAVMLPAWISNFGAGVPAPVVGANWLVSCSRSFAVFSVLRAVDTIPTSLLAYNLTANAKPSSIFTNCQRHAGTWLDYGRSNGAGDSRLYEWDRRHGLCIAPPGPAHLYPLRPHPRTTSHQTAQGVSGKRSAYRGPTARMSSSEMGAQTVCTRPFRALSDNTADSSPLWHRLFI